MTESPRLTSQRRLTGLVPWTFGTYRSLCADPRRVSNVISLQKNSVIGDRRGYDNRGRALILRSSPALNRLLLVGSEVLQIHKAVNRELVDIVLSALGKRCDVRSE
jgi:hypothetical protein